MSASVNDMRVVLAVDFILANIRVKQPVRVQVSRLQQQHQRAPVAVAAAMPDSNRF